MKEQEIDEKINNIMDCIASELGDEVHDYLCSKEVPNILLDAIYSVGLVSGED